MNKKLTALLISILAIVAGIVYLKKRGKNEKCCETCPSSKDRYYFEEVNIQCGEACISPDALDKILKVQPDFKKVENNKGCASLGYMYDNTERKEGENGHGIDVDYYKKP